MTVGQNVSTVVWDIHPSGIWCHITGFSNILRQHSGLKILGANYPVTVSYTIRMDMLTTPLQKT